MLNNKISSWIYFSIIITFLFHATSQGQDKIINRDQYEIGPDEKLMITVHIFGEIKNPGEYLVPDNTNILELISKAGGPTEFSNLSNVKITRGLVSIDDLKKELQKRALDKNYKIRHIQKQVIKINLKQILDKERALATLPVLYPGDVIRVGKNAWFTWQTAIRVISQLAVVAQVWYWYSRSY